MSAPRRGVFLHVLLLSPLVGLSSSCTVLQAPVSPPAVPRELRHKITAAGLVIEAAPIRTWDD